jgi:hypothetical protein
VVNPGRGIAPPGFVGTGRHRIFEWTLTGKNAGPGGTGAHVKISGRESWRFGDDGLVAESIGSFDSAEYERQLAKTP